ncbi:MAG: galactokinase [Desulfobacterales bacterium]|nr:galactokinase [Desulfobacterales bacterium]
MDSAFSWREALSRGPVSASAPCRVDMGGTLDIRTFSYPLQHRGPCTLNIALDLRTTVSLAPHTAGRVRVTAQGLGSAEFPAGRAPYSHRLGLMFALADVFHAAGVHIRIRSDSPPRSALGGSSVAACALAAALDAAARRGRPDRAMNPRSIALLAHAVEESVAGVPCGYQDQLAAVYGGVHAWYWVPLPRAAVFQRRRVVPPGRHRELDRHLLVAYGGGIPHVSADVNRRWVRQFLAGRTRAVWGEMAGLTHRFVEAISGGDFRGAAECMRRETALRSRLTPEVLDALGRRLVAAAGRARCGARFTGAGGGGCLWAIGEVRDIDRLRPRWQEILARRPGARLLPAAVARQGLIVHPDG